MLVLSRKSGERFTIGNDVEVTVLTVSGNRVQVGVSAPVSIPIKHLPGKQFATNQQPTNSAR